jgi:SAM-dependent methyltransferase
MTTKQDTSFSGTIPEFYDRYLGPVQFAPFARELAAMLPADPGGDVVEIACGTGLVTRELRKRLAPSRRLVASDLSKAMLDYARSQAGGAGIEWREADAVQLPFRDAEFAAAVSGFGMMFVPDKANAMREIRRVLRPGGRFILSTWDRLEENTCARVYAETIESQFPGDAEMVFRVPWSLHDDAMVRGLLEGGGFGDVRIRRLRLPVTPFNARDIATGQVRGTPRGLLLEQRGMTMEAAVDRVAAALEKVNGKAHGQALLIEARAA